MRTGDNQTLGEKTGHEILTELPAHDATEKMQTDAFIMAETEETIEQEKPKPVRRRGRPRKKPVESESNQEENKVVETKNTENNPTQPKKTTRRRTSTKKTETKTQEVSPQTVDAKKAPDDKCVADTGKTSGKSTSKKNIKTVAETSNRKSNAETAETKQTDTDIKETENNIEQVEEKKKVEIAVDGSVANPFVDGNERYDEIVRRFGFKKNKQMEKDIKDIYEYLKNRKIPTTTYDFKKDKETGKTELIRVPMTKKQIKEAKKRANPEKPLNDPNQYYSAYGASSIPFAKDKYLDKLFKKYKVGQYDPVYPDYYFWFETVPQTDAKRYKNSYDSLTKKEKKRIEKLQKEYKNLKLTEPVYKKSVIDWVQIDNLEKYKGNYIFDPREIWNLDAIIPMLLYPRMKFLNKVMMGYEPTFKSMKQYKKKVIHPIIHALELHMILGGVNGDTIIHDWAEETEHSMDYAIEVMKYVSAKIAFGYHLLAEYIFGLWD